LGRSQTKSQEKRRVVQSEFDRALATFSHRDFLSTDPLQIPHRYHDKKDQECTAFIAATFAFGNVRSILATLQKVLEPLGPEPVNTLIEWRPGQIKAFSKGLYYRFFSASDIESLFMTLRHIYRTSPKGLESLIPSHGSHLQRLAEFRRMLTDGLRPSPGLKFMFPDPLAGAAKRLHMFMRWMVRRDDVDLGLWSSVDPANLLIPLDTHIFGICRGVNLTQRKQPGLAAVLELTEVFRTWDPNDPIKYDFALCRLGILKQKKDFITNFKALARAL